MGRKKTITDEDLLAVARTVFLQQGFGVATKVIAKAAGVSEGVLFQRFTNKNELFFAAMVPPPAAELDELLRVGQPPVGREDMGRLTMAMTAYFKQLLPVLVKLMGHPDFRFEEFAQRHPGSPLVTLRRSITEFMKDQQARGGLSRQLHPGAAALTIWATAWTVASFELMGAHGGRMDPLLIQATVDSLWDGLKPREIASVTLSG